MDIWCPIDFPNLNLILMERILTVLREGSAQLGRIVSRASGPACKRSRTSAAFLPVVEREPLRCPLGVWS
ncbi:unnamed protein product [Gongylonema pulchrum]|uniref:Uncharacterized protein n=1 Tax=Gongylonema pulchrum TaxID=637853 RepID=A0A183EJI8_9BILA|nr:unnamed protein product [Gongylonema pulchrum]